MSKSGYIPDNTNIHSSSGTPNLIYNTRDNVFLKEIQKTLPIKLRLHNYQP